MTRRQHIGRTTQCLTGTGTGVYGTSYWGWWWYSQSEEGPVS